MKTILLVLGLVVLLGCEVPIADINEWWQHDVLKHTEEEETATVTIGLSWPGDD